MSKSLALTLSLLGYSLFIFQFTQNVPGAFDGSSPADFPNYYFAGKRFFQNRAIYDNLASEVRRAFNWDYSVYPADTPFTIILLSPLSLLDYHIAWLTMVVISTLVIFLTTERVTSELKFSTTSRLLATALVLSSAATIFLLKRNHMESLVLGCAVIGWLAMRRESDKWAGLCWGLAATMKLFPLLWIMGAFLCGRRKVFWTGIVIFLITTAISGVLILPYNFERFIFEIIPRSQEWYGTIANYSMISVLTALAGLELGILWGTICSLVVLFVLAKKLKVLNQVEPIKQSDYLTIYVVSSSLLLSPLAWLNYFILIWPALFIIMRDSDLTKTSERWLIFLLLLASWNWPQFIETPFNFLTVMLSSLPTIGLVLLLRLPVPTPHH